MDHETANVQRYRWLEELQVAEVLAGLTSALVILLGFLNA